MKKMSILLIFLFLSFKSISQTVVRPSGFVVVMCDGKYTEIKSGYDCTFYFVKDKKGNKIMVGVSYILHGLTFWHPKYKKECK